MFKLFEDAGKTPTRSWQCFVCGKQYKTYEEYKTHIVTEHVEGREYITCPDCQAPVRHLVSHYKAKHQSRIMPKNMQTKVAVWHDFASNGKKKKTRKPTFEQGYFESNKMNKSLYYYRSGYEREVYNFLEADTDVSAYYAEPLKIPYHHQGAWHDYVPDLRVEFIDASVEIWEIKPASQTHYEVNKSKWAAASNFSENHGWKFNVITEVGIGKLKQKIKRQQNS